MFRGSLTASDSVVLLSRLTCQGVDSCFGDIASTRFGGITGTESRSYGVQSMAQEIKTRKKKSIAAREYYTHTGLNFR